MASTYERPDSPFIWFRYKDATGKWKAKNSGYRKDNPHDIRQAEIVARQKSVDEATTKILTPGRSEFRAWAAQWLEQRFATNSPLTLIKYRRFLRIWLEYATEVKATSPAAVTREIVLGFETWRRQHGASRNSILDELTFVAQILDEAVSRGYANANVARKLGLQTTQRKPKEVWTPEQIKVALDEAEKIDRFGWIRTVILMGRWQASRIGQCEVPLSGVDLERREFRFPGKVMKGGKPFTQAIDPRFLPELSEIVAHRHSLGFKTLCDLPTSPSASMVLRRFLDRLGFTEISHHCLRVTWVTNAALAGVPESAAMRWVNHSSREVHAIYQRIGSNDVVKFLELMK